ncbi:hypothetical protein Pcinc_001579 [Petrolisthes cinctipes]|uniref:Uncharacterized protein n=1 Tax=Petrolisthes cinctipes TaxID=88211 RepID=A0AAE1GLB9_PETCI|nr:hypothetical protein Pcinc_001579 [Petrolisthes cinctipes]
MAGDMREVEGRGEIRTEEVWEMKGKESVQRRGEEGGGKVEGDGQMSSRLTNTSNSNTQPSSSPPTTSYTNTHTNTRKLDRRGEGAKISKQGRVTRPTAKRVAPPRPPQAKIPPTPRQNPSQSKMTMDESKDSATSPIIAQSPPPQIGQQNSEGFNFKRAGERLIEAGSV